MSRIKIKIDRTQKRFRLKSPVKNIDIPVKKIVCRTTRIPSVNRLSWQLSFNREYGNEFKKFLDENLPVNKIISKKDFEKIFFKTYPKKMWKDDLDDVLHTFESKPHKELKLYIKNGEIVKLKRI